MGKFFPHLFPCLACLALASAGASQALPAFPGAQGFGSQTPGGRGGRIIEVANLNDAGPGSLRSACTETGPRIILFRTGGVVRLKSEIQLVSPYVTLAGQTAPGDGIVVADHFITVLTHDVIIRGMRFRVGDDTSGERPEIRDCLAILEPSASEIIVDHCSMSWAIDETASAGNGAHHITYQWCIFGEALYASLHSKTPGHSMGLILAYGATRTSVHHCLFAHNDGRNPLIAGGSHEFVNNVIFNWGYGSEFQERYSGPDTFPLFADVAGNYWKPLSDRPTGGERPLHINFAYAGTESRLYCAGNLYLGNPFYTAADKAGLGALREILPDSSALDTSTGLAVQSAPDAYDTVLVSAGALHPARDTVDRRIVRSVRDSAGRIVDCVGPDTIFFPQGRAQGGGDTSIILDSSTSSNEPRGYTGRRIEIIAGTGAGQVRTITSYLPGYVDSAGRPVYVWKAGVAPAWTAVPDTTSLYRMIIPCGNNAGGWPVYRTGTPPADTDRDGMPDAWETSRGLNPGNGADGNLATLSPAGYTNVEVYLNGLFDDYQDNLERSAGPGIPPELIIVPNPFSAGITIRYAAPQGESFRLQILDAEGRILKRLEKSGVESGYRIWNWDGRDLSGRKVANGIYLVRLEAPGLRLKKRIILAR